MHAPDHKTWCVDLPGPEATDRLGELLAEVIEPGMVIWLEGDLGAGKTALVRAVIRALGYAGPVKSPTYSLVELYRVSRLCLHHFDFYRLRAPEEFLDAGLDEYFDGTAACFVEWPDKAGSYLPAADLRVCLSFVDAGRHLQIQSSGERGQRCLAALINGWRS